ncbi:MAG TPA: hypothetical protein VJ754_10660, partial [Anaerolineae bacterium]|nr:hypothetical protein [Anaerolineae bacterium]
MATATIGTLAVKLAAITGDFNNQISGAVKHLEKISKAAKEAAIGSAAAFAGITGTLVVATRESSEALKAQRQLGAAFAATGQSLDVDRFNAFAESMQDLTTTGDDAVVAMGALMASFGLSQNQIEALIPGVLDLSAATGTAADTIAQKLVLAVQTGEASLARYGIALTDTEQEVFKYGSTSDRTAMLVQKLANFQGQAAAEVSTAVGKFTQLRNALDNTLEEVGKLMDTPLASMLDGVRDAVHGMTERIANLNPAAKELFANIIFGATVTTGLAAALTSIAVVLPSIIKGFGFMAAAIKVVGTTLLPVTAMLLGALTILGQIKQISSMGG